MTTTGAKLLLGIVISILLVASAPSAKAARERPAAEPVERLDKPIEKTNSEASAESRVPTAEAVVPVISDPREVALDDPEMPSWRSPEAGEVINWYCVATGGGTSTSPSFSIAGTIGQTAVGVSSSTSTVTMHGFWQNFEHSTVACCTGLSVSDVNCSGAVDITDVSVMIDHLFLSLPPLCCAEEGNINYPGSGLPGESEVTDIVDLQIMIDNQFLTLEPLPPCP